MIASIITSHISKNTTQLQLAFSNFLKKKIILNELHHYGITVTYDEFKIFKASAACAAAKSSIQKKISGSKLIQAVGDNFDATISSQNDLKQTHSMAVILTQQTAQNDIIDDYDVIPRLNKDEIKESIMPAAENFFYKGPKNPGMPVSESMKQVFCLKVLAHQVVSLNRAHNLDFLFFKEVSEKENPIEYNGFNTKLVRESGWALQPMTKVQYLPLIVMIPLHPDTILTIMHLVNTLTENAGQKYTVFTCDQQLYQIVVQMKWSDSDTFCNFIPRLGGMHMLMSFIGCVGK